MGQEVITGEGGAQYNYEKPNGNHPFAIATEYKNCGLLTESLQELNKIKGLNSKDLYKTLGYASEEEAIHRNNLVIS